MKNEKIYAYFIIMFGFTSLFYMGLIIFGYIREILNKIHIKRVKGYVKRYLMPQNKIEKIFTIIIVTFLVFFYISILIFFL